MGLIVILQEPMSSTLSNKETFIIADSPKSEEIKKNQKTSASSRKITKRRKSREEKALPRKESPTTQVEDIRIIPSLELLKDLFSMKRDPSK